MPQTVKKQTSQASFTLGRWARKLSNIKFSSLIIAIVVIAVAIALLGGTVYDLAVKPLVYAYYNQRFYFILSRSIGGSAGDQFASETAITSVLYAFGLIGLLAIYQSSKHAYNPRQAYIMFIAGVALLFLAYAFLEATLNMKLA